MVSFVFTDFTKVDDRSLVGKPGALAKRSTALSGLQSRVNRS